MEIVNEEETTIAYSYVNELRMVTLFIAVEDRYSQGLVGSDEVLFGLLYDVF